MLQRTLSQDDLPVRPGDLIAGKYRVEGILGKGGMGVIATAMHEELQERVAIKFLLLDEANKADLGRRFLREARLAVKIRSDHVVRVIDLGKLADGMPYMVMEHLVGMDLSAFLRERGPLPVGEAVAYILQVCAGVAAAHALGIVHRDIKPANLFLTTGPTGAPLVKILDFGISKHLYPEDAELQTKLTGPAMVMGSLRYMSPEQIRSTSDVDGRSDVWSIGVILFELITGKRPFVSAEPMGVVAAICSDPPILLRKLCPDAPEALESILLQCLDKNVDHRIQSAFDLACALDPFHEPVSYVAPTVLTKDAARSRSSIFSLSSLSIPIPLTPTGAFNTASDSRRCPPSEVAAPVAAPEDASIPPSNDPKPSPAEIAMITGSYALLRRLPAMIAIAVTGAALAGGAITFVGVHQWASPQAPAAPTIPVPPPQPAPPPGPLTPATAQPARPPPQPTASATVAPNTPETLSPRRPRPPVPVQASSPPPKDDLESRH